MENHKNKLNNVGKLIIIMSAIVQRRTLTIQNGQLENQNDCRDTREKKEQNNIINMNIICICACMYKGMY